MKPHNRNPRVPIMVSGHPCRTGKTAILCAQSEREEDSFDHRHCKTGTTETIEHSEPAKTRIRQMPHDLR